MPHQYEVSAHGFFAILHHGFEIDAYGLIINHADGTWDMVNPNGNHFEVSSYVSSYEGWAVPAHKLETTQSTSGEEATLP